MEGSRICMKQAAQGARAPARVEKRRIWRVRGLKASNLAMFNSGGSQDTRPSAQA